MAKVQLVEVTIRGVIRIEVDDPKEAVEWAGRIKVNAGGCNLMGQKVVKAEYKGEAVHHVLQPHNVSQGIGLQKG